MRFGPREFVFVLLLLAMPIAAHLIVFEERNARIAEVRERVQQREVRLEQLESATRSFADMGEEIEKLSNAIEMFEQKLPAEREVEVIVQQVWELAARQQLNCRSIRPDKPVSAAGYSEQPIRMVITGDFDGFYSFLLDIEKLRRITAMPEVKIKKIDAADGQMQAEMILSIFFEAQTNGEGNRL